MALTKLLFVLLLFCNKMCNRKGSEIKYLSDLNTNFKLMSSLSYNTVTDNMDANRGVTSGSHTRPCHQHSHSNYRRTDRNTLHILPRNRHRGMFTIRWNTHLCRPPWNRQHYCYHFTSHNEPPGLPLPVTSHHCPNLLNNNIRYYQEALHNLSLPHVRFVFCCVLDNH